MKSHVVFNPHIKEFQRSVVSVRVTPCYSLCLVFIPIPIFIHTFVYTNVIAVLKKIESFVSSGFLAGVLPFQLHVRCRFVPGPRA